MNLDRPEKSRRGPPPTSALYTIGADEVGYGPIAGPLVVCAALASVTAHIKCRDSKKYHSYTKMAADIGQSSIVHHCIVEVSSLDICKMGVRQSLAFAYRESVAGVRQHPLAAGVECVIDGNAGHGIANSRTLVKADQLHPATSAASCLAKLRQVKAMMALAEKYPMFGFDSHHGYGTPQHVASIVKYGYVPGVHRVSILRKMPLLHGKLKMFGS